MITGAVVAFGFGASKTKGRIGPNLKIACVAKRTSEEHGGLPILTQKDVAGTESGFEVIEKDTGKDAHSTLRMGVWMMQWAQRAGAKTLYAVFAPPHRSRGMQDLYIVRRIVGIDIEIIAVDTETILGKETRWFTRSSSQWWTQNLIFWWSHELIVFGLKLTRQYTKRAL